MHKALALWGGWLVTCLVFFSMAKFFHSYYMVLLIPGLAGSVGLAVAAVRSIQLDRPRLALWVLALAGVLTVGFQVYLAAQMGVTAWWVLAAGGVALTGAAALGTSIFWKAGPSALAKAGILVTLLAMVVIPLGWSVLTVLDARGNSAMPAAYSGNSLGNDRMAMNGGGPGSFDGRAAGAPPANRPTQASFNADGNLALPASGGMGGGFGSSVSTEMLAYLQANTQGVEYLLAVPSSHVGSSLVLQTGRPVLFMGGFSGSDPVIDGNGLSKLVAAGKLRYVLAGGTGGADSGSSSITTWLQNNCTTVAQFSQLYQCSAVTAGLQ
jgi:4-amino-4-deoxy-L-arabinose transferase-like glycosyltransferase